MTPAARLFFWRTNSGVEVDFVLEHGRKVLAIEVKHTAQPGFRDAAGLRAFLSEHPDAQGGLLLHSGREIRRLDENILAVPWPLVTG
jgi:predicted AAA+ superfamily ATPase